MIDLIVWSKNRAMQLHLLLESIKLNAPNLFNITIIYTGSDNNYKKAYKKLINRKIYPAIYIKERDFYNDTLNAITNNNKYIAFSTDDNVCYRPCPYDYSKLQQFLPKWSTECFSFRLGLNTIVQNTHTGQLQPPLNKYYATSKIVFWNKTLYHPLSNYGYGFSVDMHVYCTEWIIEMLSNLHFDNCNSLEGQMHNQNSSHITYMSSFEQSVTVNMPINNMSNITLSNNKYTPQTLNDKYLNDKKISFATFNNVNVCGCHQEFKLKFTGA